MSKNTKRNWPESEESDETDEESPRKLVANDERRCIFCVKLFKDIIDVKKHETECDAALKNTAELVNTKDGKKRFICDICFRTFKFLTGIKKHKIRHEPPGGFICQYCDARYCSDFELQKHKELTHMAYKCQICKEKFLSKESYEEHIINIHDGRDRIYVVCEDCGEQFKTRTVLSFHKQSNCGTFKPFKCDQCGSYFQNQWSLKNHKKIHKGEKKFCCSYCGNSFVNKGQLTNHERRHTQEKPFVCEVCSKAFAHRESLVTHSSVHTGIKPYLCEACGACFSCIGNLIKHRRNRPQTCGLPQYTNTAKVAPRPSFKSGKFKAKTKIPKGSMVLVDDVKNVKNNSEIKKQVKQEIVKKIRESDNELMSSTDNPEATNTPLDNEQNTESYLNDGNSDESITLLKSKNTNKIATNKEEIFYVIKISENMGDDDNDLNNFSPHDDNMDITDFLNIDNYNNEKSEFEVKEEEEKENNDVIPKIEDFDTIKQEDDFIIDENLQQNEAKEEVNIVLEEMLENIDNDDYDDGDNNDDDDGDNNDDEEDNIPLSKIKLGIINTKAEENLSNITKRHSKPNKKSRIKKKTEFGKLTKKNKTVETVKHSRRRRRRRREKNILFSVIQENQTYECDQCPKMYQQRRPFAKHLIGIHKMNILEVEEFIDNLNKTKNDNDNEEFSIRCKYCGKIYYQVAALKKHEILHGPEGSLIHKCRCCNTYFATPEKALKHAKSDHADKLTCKICNKIYSCNEALIIHRKLVHDKQLNLRKKANNVCQKCGRKFVNKTTLNDHERSNCGQNPLYKCEICNKQYHSAGTLKTHQNIHTGNYQYKCSHCDKTCRTPGQLKVHERKHTGEKPFKCDTCDKAFAYRESLLTHYTLHTGIKRYTCYGCGQRFSCISNLQNHRRTHKDTCGTLPLNSKASTSMGVSRGILCFGNKLEN